MYTLHETPFQFVSRLRMRRKSTKEVSRELGTRELAIAVFATPSSRTDSRMTAERSRPYFYRLAHANVASQPLARKVFPSNPVRGCLTCCPYHSVSRLSRFGPV